MKIGFTSTSFRQIKDIEKIVRIASSCGAEIIEWGGDIHVKNMDDALKAKVLCDSAGIKISSYGSYYRVGSGNVQQWEDICMTACGLGCDSVRVWLGTKDSEKTGEAEYAKIVEDARHICRRAADFGFKVCPECHDNTYNNNTDAFLKIYDDIGCDNFGTYFQSRYRRREYDLDRIERTLPYIESVHISYSEQTREQLFRQNPKYIDALLDKLTESGFDGNLLLEYTYLFSYCGIPSCMKKDMEKIRKKVGEIK